MTSPKDSKDPEEPKTHGADGDDDRRDIRAGQENDKAGTAGEDTEGTAAENAGSAASTGNDAEDLDASWRQFEQDHAADLEDISKSKSARQFEKQARRKRKHTEPVLSVDDLMSDSFAKSTHGGPRDFTGSSWLDADSTMDGLGGFTPPNPQIGHISTVKVVFWALLIVGVCGLIATVFFPNLAGALATVFGLCALVGATGIIVQHKGFTETRDDYFDDGARV